MGQPVGIDAFKLRLGVRDSWDLHRFNVTARRRNDAIQLAHSMERRHVGTATAGRDTRAGVRGPGRPETGYGCGPGAGGRPVFFSNTGASLAMSRAVPRGRVVQRNRRILLGPIEEARPHERAQDTPHLVIDRGHRHRGPLKGGPQGRRAEEGARRHFQVQPRIGGTYRTVGRSQSDMRIPSKPHWPFRMTLFRKLFSVQ